MSLNNLSIRYQMLLPVIGLILALVLTIGMANEELEVELDNMHQTTASVLENKDLVAKVINNTFMLRISAIYSIFDVEQLNRLDKELVERMNKNKQTLAELRKFKGIESKVDATIQAMDDYQNFTANTMIPLLKQRIEGVNVEEEYKKQTKNFRRIGNVMVNAIAELSNQLNVQTGLVQQDIQVQHQELIQTIFMVFVAVFALITLVAWWLAGQIVKPITELQKVMGSVAQGELNIKAEVKGTNEIAVLNKDVNTTITQLNQTASSLANISREVASSATELAAVMTQSESNAKTEQNEIAHITNALNELATTASSVSHHALDADASAKQADDMARQGLAIFEQSQIASEKMNTTLCDAAQIVSQVKDQSEKISQVIEVIQGISEQTNLLALNAAIEAARAGESGRGFAVVADEVRLLAARTQDSTQEIQTIIESLQSQSNLANDGMTSSLNILSQNQSLAQEVNQALEGITQAISRISDMNTQVATSAEQQSQVTKDINANVSNMSQVVSQNVSGISQSSSASHNLSQLAEKQNQELAFFKL